MAAPVQLTGNELVLKYTTAAGGCTIGEGVVLASDTTVQDAGAASDLAIGIAKETTVSGALVEIAMFGQAVIPVTVGTGGATRGTKAVLVATGFTDAATHNSDNGGGNTSVYGIFLQTAVATVKVGLLLTGTDSRGV